MWNSAEVGKVTGTGGWCSLYDAPCTGCGYCRDEDEDEDEPETEDDDE